MTQFYFTPSPDKQPSPEQRATLSSTRTQANRLPIAAGLFGERP
jgi:hypothetical protein